MKYFNIKWRNKIASYLILIMLLILIVRVCVIQSYGLYERFHNKAPLYVKQTLMRHKIVDRNGNIVAISVPVYEYHINPSFIIDINVVIDKILKIFPDLDRDKLYNRLDGDVNGWFLVKKDITPEQKELIIASGIEGSFFNKYYKRFYPYGDIFSHVVGYTLGRENDEVGAKGIEKSMNDALLSRDVSITLDSTVQNIIYEKLMEYFVKYNARSAFAILVDLKTREVISSVSLPSFDPSEQINPNALSHVNVPISSTFNLGSVFKVYTVALAIANGYKPKQIFALPHSIPVTSTFSITDEHRVRDNMTLEEILAYSSNVGVSLIVQKVGFEKQKQFFEDIGIFKKINGIGLPSSEIARPLFIEGNWKDSMHYTASYGYGVSISPMHFLQIASGLVYDGQIKPLKFIKDMGNVGQENAKKILNDDGIKNIQDMMRSVVEIGTARRATINGYSVCGKTGTALKFDPEIKKWNNHKKLLSFFSIFPCNNPRYAMYIGLNEPNSTSIAYLQASNTVVKTSSEIIQVVAPILNTIPDKDGNN